MKLLKTITQPLWQVMVFGALFLLISGLAGPRIISGGILFRDGFAQYGGIGKTIIFGLIAFAVLARHQKTPITLHPWRPAYLGWILASAAAFALAWQSIGQLLTDASQIAPLVLAHAGLLLSVAFAAIGCAGPANLQLLWRKYTRQIITAAGLAIAFFLFLQAVYALWRPLSSIVLVSVTFLLDISGLHSTFVPPHSLLFDRFGITVAEYCSGIESIALFTSLYAIVGLLDWRKLRKKRYFVVFPIALAVLFMLNIVRVYGLIMAGYYINQDLAFSLFHTYAGMMFFILYSAAFWAIAYKHLIRHER